MGVNYKGAIALAITVIAFTGVAYGQVVVGSARTWPFATLPGNVIVDVEGLPGDLDARMNQAIQLWNDKAATLIMLTRGTGRLGTAYVRARLQFSFNTASSAVTGYIGPFPHWLYIAEDASAAAIVHELGHVFGLDHSHNHCNRDDFIELGPEASQDDFARSSCTPGRLFVYTLPDHRYDFRSVMHYSDDGGNYWKPKPRGLAELQRLGLIKGRLIAVGALDNPEYGTTNLSEEDVNSLRALYKP